MRLKPFHVMVVIFILIFVTVFPVHASDGFNNAISPTYISGDKTTTQVSNVSNGGVNIVTSSSTPSYYIENESACNSTEYTFNVTGGINPDNNGGTENYIILKQENKTLFSISYGRKDTITTVSGSQDYNGILNLSGENIMYSVHIIMNNDIQNHALIWEGKEPAIPHVIALKNSYNPGNISFMFGGQFSNQTIGKLSVKHYTGLLLPGSQNTHKLTYKKSFILNPAPIKKNQTAFLDSSLNSIIYIHYKGVIERYNYYTNNYSTLGEIHNFQTENISSIQSGSHYIYYTWNNSFTSIYTINKTDLSVENYTYRNYNMTHLLFFNGNYVFYNLNGDMTFANGDKINIANVSILKVNVSRAINIIAKNKTGIESYTVTVDGQILNTGEQGITGHYNIKYFYINNGISSYFERGNLSRSINGYLYYHFSYIANNIGIDNGNIVQSSQGSVEALGVNAPDTMSSSNGTIIAANGQNIELYSNFTIASPYKITIRSVNEKVEFNSTILTLDINSGLPYHIVAVALNKTYNTNNSTLNLTFTGIHSGYYTIDFMAANIAGYTYNSSYVFQYNDSKYISNNTVTAINNVRIINDNGKFYVKINGNLIANATIAWYVNGKYSNTGKSLTTKLSTGIDKISVKITDGGKTYTDSRIVYYTGNLPYYAGFTGVFAILAIFLFETLYFNNKNVDELIIELNGSTLKKILKSGRRKRISGKLIRSRIKALNISGKISIERDMDNHKFIFADKSFIKSTREPVHGNRNSENNNGFK
ncbi:hypothetical protein FAD_0730 [Ferroplasma acidiphilum]|uniref:Uncharacterized protein n=1 Tax=Ferroplasma acidiphilum TaxID=74969 RepID=A0A1V0N3I9_9ARCH|nr:hypothetical protein [Ferroplasma acidiphilum]ARD84636.1 hypothetical protein FAD_0730 [Ferroplasma acidiphilum]